MIAEARSPPLAARDIHFSHSALRLYQACPLRWHFKYVAGLPEGIVSASMVTGGALHQALEAHYTAILCGRRALSLDDLLDVFWDRWRELNGVKVRFPRGEDIDSVGRLAQRILLAFLASDLARPEGTIIGIEEPLRGQVIPGVPDIVGRLDLLLETADEIVVIDFKSARSAWSREHVEDASLQLLLYHELVKPIAGDKPIRLEFALLTKTKVPDIVIHAVEPSAQQIERAKIIVKRVWSAIEGDAIYPNPSAMNCPGCPYRAACRAWTG